MSDEANVNEEVKEEVENEVVAEAVEPKTVVPDPAAIKAAIAEKNAAGDQDDEDEESENSVNPLGLLVHCVIVVICVHGYLQYNTDFSSGINWTMASASVLLPIINLYWVFCGLIYYWEIHWALALIITGTCLLALLPKGPGYICATICIALFIICASHTFPKRVGEYQMADDFRSGFDSDMALVSQIATRDDAKRLIKKRIAESKTVRARALRLGYKRLAKAAGDAAK